MSFTKAYHHKNPIIFSRSENVAYSDEDNYRILCIVKVETEPGSGEYTPLLEVAHTPDVNGQTKFNVREAFRGLFDPQPPAENNNTTRLITDCSILAKNTYGNLYNDLTTPVAPVDSMNYLVVYGGLEKKDYPNYDFFLQHIYNGAGTKLKYLSWAPLTRYMDRIQENYIRIYSPGDPWNYYEVLATIYYDDGTTAENEILFNLTGFPKGNIVEIPIGPANSGVLSVDPTKNVTYYEITVINGDINLNADINAHEQSETITIYLTDIRPVNTKYFLFLNSLGSYEVIRTTGKGEKTAEIIKTIVQNYLPADHDSDYGEIAVHSSSNKRSDKRSTGYYEDQEMINWLQDFALSKKVYDITDGTRKPVVINDVNITVEKDDDYRYFMRFTAEEVYSNDVFTP